MQHPKTPKKKKGSKKKKRPPGWASKILEDLPQEILEDRGLSYPQFGALLGYSASQTRAKVRLGELPQPIKLSARHHIFTVRMYRELLKQRAAGAGPDNNLPRGPNTEAEAAA